MEFDFGRYHFYDERVHLSRRGTCFILEGSTRMHGGLFSVFNYLLYMKDQYMRFLLKERPATAGTGAYFSNTYTGAALDVY